MTETLKDFSEYTKEELSNLLPEGYYHLAVREATVDEWPNGSIRFDVATAVVSGAKAGKYGPRHSFSFDAYSGANFSATEEDRWITFINAITAMRNGQPIDVPSGGPTEEVLTSIAAQIKGDEFVIKVIIKDEEFNNTTGKVFAMSKTPKGLNVDEVTSAFNVDDV